MQINQSLFSLVGKKEPFFFLKRHGLKARGFEMSSQWAKVSWKGEESVTNGSDRKYSLPRFWSEHIFFLKIPFVS